LLLAAWAMLLHRLDAVPPGFQHDQMFNTFDALEALSGRLRLYYPANFGREPLGIYFGALGLGIAEGHHVWGLRFGTVIAGMLALAATFSLAMRYLSAWGSLLAAGLLAGSFWFVFTARLGLEPMLVVPLAASAFYLMHRGLFRSATRDLALAGVPAAAGVYTYLAGRVLYLLAPMLLLHEVCAAWLVGRRDGKVAAQEHWRNVRGLALSSAVMLALTLPILWYVRTSATLADQRLGELGGPLLAALQGDFSPVASKALEAALALMWSGSTAIPYHYNIPGRPVMQPLLALLFLLGLASTVWYWIRPPQHVARSGEFLLLVGLALGIMPVVLTGADALHMRGVVALPLLFLLAARGAEGIAHLCARLLVRQLGRVPPKAQWLAVGLGAVLVVSQWIVNGQAYFEQWASAEPTQRIYNADFRAAAAYLSRNPSVEPAFIGTDRQLDLDQRTYFLYGPARSDARWFYLPANPPVPREGAARYLLPGETDLPPVLALLEPRATTHETLPGPDGEHDLLRALRVDAAAVAALLAESGARPLEEILTYGDALRLITAGIQDRGQHLDLITEWETTGPWPFEPPPGEAPTPPKLAVSLYDDAGYRWAQADVAAGIPYRTWQTGDRLLETLELPIPGDIPPGHYAVRLAVYDDRGGTLPARTNGGGAAGDGAIGSITLAPGPSRGVTGTAPYPIEAGEVGALRPLGRWEPLEALTAGIPTDLHVSWAAGNDGLAARGLHFTLRATDSDGNLLWEQAADPLAPLPEAWPAGQVYRLTHRLLPQTPQPGEVDAILELCAERDGEPISCAVVGTPRVVNAPPVTALSAPPQVASGATWSSGLTLAGYDLARAGEQQIVTFYWLVGRAQPAALARFVHGVDGSGSIVAQADATPDNGGLPMTVWRVGEYVADAVPLSIPAGADVAELRVGWYDPRTGARIPATGPDGAPLSDDYLPLSLE
jgi:hypothetical protein